MDRESLARELSSIALLTGTFRLRSGTTANQYFDKYQFEAQPRLLKAIADHLQPLIPEGTEILAGLELGGIPIATALSLRTGLPQVMVRKTAKEYGTQKAAEGPAVRQKKVCVVEDVVTTGGQIIQSVDLLRKEGAEVRNILCVIQREASATQKLESQKLQLISLFQFVEGALV